MRTSKVLQVAIVDADGVGAVFAESVEHSVEFVCGVNFDEDIERMRRGRRVRTA